MGDQQDNRRSPVLLPRRHPAHVTADRLKDAVDRYGHLLSGQERDDFSHVIFALEEIGDVDRHV